jgi:hypothetical protein
MPEEGARGRGWSQKNGIFFFETVRVEPNKFLEEEKMSGPHLP